MITKVILPLSCALLIAGLMGLAMLKGIDGKCLALSVALIGGLGGYGIREVIQIVLKK